jgi:hypothetical protein
MEAEREVMSERHELCAAAMRQYGTDPDGVERAMRAAGYSDITAVASRDTYADFLRKNGYDVDGPAGMDAPAWAVEQLAAMTDSGSQAPESVPEPEVVVDTVDDREPPTLRDVTSDTATAAPVKRKPGRPKRGGR